MRVLVFLVLAVGVNCSGGSTAPVEPTAVRFQIDAPFCGGSLMSIEFTIDQTVVGTETLKHGQTSQPYATSAGSHRLHAALSGRAVVQDTTVTLPGGATFTDVVGVYCS